MTMNEATIVQTLSKNIPRSEPLPAPDAKGELDMAPVIKTALDEAIKPTNNTLGGMRLMDYFSVPGEMQKDPTTLEKLQYIFSWASTATGSEEPSDVIMHIRQMEAMLGTTYREDKLEAIWRWLKLDEERRRIDKAQSII